MEPGLNRAYAVLELSPPVSEPDLTRRYRELVKRRHPDRHGSDPTGQAEAARRMQEINDAHRLVASQLRREPTPKSAGGASEHASSRLTRTDIDGIVWVRLFCVDVFLQYFRGSWPVGARPDGRTPPCISSRGA